ncbi:energy-coupling factor ABC transporter ATP-binding protein [Treponema sp.]|uniref:energy-coupling factor ABC transporter ATP-binding protein n=1 Tax=Treponema sp. TaxID=166 RepID=UPI003F006BB2
MKALEVTGVSKIFADKTIALEDISFSIDQGEFCVIAGSNGSGKSVLMSLIAGLDEPTGGSVNLFGNSAGLVFQDADSQILGETPEEDVAFGAKNFGLKKEALEACVKSSLEQTGLLHKRSAYARTLSGGEKRRLAVSGILATNRSLIIFDEPFANLDWPGVRQVCAVLKKLKDEKKTIIVLTHELEKILALADKFIVLDKGKIRFEGTPQEGLRQNLEQWSIKNPAAHYSTLEDMLWL